MRLLVSLLSLSLLAAPLLRAADAPAAPAQPPPNLAPLKKWLAGQAAIRTVQADFVQTRAYRTFNDPIAVPGRIWFSAPHSFRWELGDPPKTVVLRKGDSYYVIQPTKQRAERSSVADVGKKVSSGNGPMFDFPFAKDFDDFNRRFEVLSLATTGNFCHVEMTAKDPQMAKFLSVFKLDFDTGDGHVLAFEFVLKNGSFMRNEFSNVRLNGKIEPGRFDYDLTGYNVTDPKP